MREIEKIKLKIILICLNEKFCARDLIKNIRDKK
jgi:hypothetical protein